MDPPPVDRLLNEILRCCICLENVGTEPKTFRMCGHSLCHGCYLYRGLRLDVIECPECRATSYIGADPGRPDNNTRGPLPNNIMIANAVQFLTENRAKMVETRCKMCGQCDQANSLCGDCVKSYAKEAVKKAKPKYRYSYDERPLVERISSEVEHARKKVKVGSQEVEEREKIQNKKKEPETKENAEQIPDGANKEEVEKDEISENDESPDDCVLM